MSKLEEIRSLTRRYHEIMNCQARLKLLKKEIDLQIDRSKLLAQKVESEYQDVKRIENQPLFKLFSMFLQNESDRLQIEKQEYLQASIEYNESISILEVLNYEYELLLKKSKEGVLILDVLEKKIKEHEDATVDASGRFIAEYKELLKDYSALIKLRLEIEEALEVNRQMITHFNQMIKHLNQAQEMNNWGNTYAEKQQGKAYKKSEIDAAQEQVYYIHKLLVILNAELKDVQEVRSYFKTSEVMIKSFNIQYYRDLINDWMQNNNLMAAMTTSLNASSAINKLMHSLERGLLTIDSEFELLDKRKEELLIKMQY